MVPNGGCDYRELMGPAEGLNSCPHRSAAGRIEYRRKTRHVSHRGSTNLTLSIQAGFCALEDAGHPVDP
jgi:hypothetical protein